MTLIASYKSKYGSTKTYARWIAEELGCSAVDAKDVKAEDLEQYDVIVYGGGLYAEVIAGVCLITKNLEENDVCQRKSHRDGAAFGSAL